MIIVIGAIAAAAFTGIVLLIRFISSGDTRTALWAVALVLATATAAVFAQIASIYYTMPIGWLVAIGVAMLVVVALVWRIGTDAEWKLPKVIALAAVMLLSMVALTFVAIAAPAGELLTPLFETRASQIAEANGFEPLLPTEAELNTDAGLPVDDTADGEGLTIGYTRFVLVERAAEGPLDHDELTERARPGTRPVGDIGPGSEIPEDAQYTELQLGARPALGVSYKAVTEENLDDVLGLDEVRLLLFERDGVQVVLYSQGSMEYQSDGSYTPRSPLSFDELVRIAESLEPVR